MKLLTDQIPAALTAFTEAGLPRLLFVTHAWGGGVEQHVATLAKLISDRARVMVLRPAEEDSIEIELPGHKRFRLASDNWSLVQNALKAMRFDRVHVHHVHGLPQAILDIDLALEVPLDLTLHDFTSVCPQYQLVDPEGRYCGEPEDAGCNRCIRQRPHAWQLNIGEWREAFDRVLNRADRVFAPSMGVLQKVKHYFPSVDVICLPHAEPAVAPPQVVKVALLGALSNVKGLSVALSVAAYAEASQSPLVLRLIGHAAEPLPRTLTATGSYETDDLPKLIASERPDVIWLPSQVPETFSFTLSAALASGLPIVASNIGALADRLRDVPNATLLAFDAASAAWHSALIAASKLSPYAREPASTSPPSASSSAINAVEMYVRTYLADLPLVSAASLTLAPAQWSTAGHLPLARSLDRPLVDLFRIGVYGGHRPSLHVIERALEALPFGDTHIVGLTQYENIRAALEQANLTLVSNQEQYAEVLETMHEAHSEESQRCKAVLDDTDQRAQAAREYIAHLEALVQQQKAHNEKIEATRSELLLSTSWRMTRPLRGAVRVARHGQHMAQTTLQLIPRIPVLLRGGLTRFRRGGWRNVRDRLAIEFRPIEISATLKLPDVAAQVIVPLILHTNPVAPLVTILIPVYGQHATTFACLNSISEYPLRRPFEVIVMDDYSPEPAAEALAQISGIRIIRNESNLGFIGNVNVAATHARGHWLIILNNDTIVRQGALDAMLDTFDTHKNVGLVGAKLLNADGTVQEAGGIAWRDGSAWNWGRGQRREDPRFNFVRDADFCSGAALAIDRKLFADMGGFDAHYAPAYYEDTDLAFRIRARGLRVLYQPAAEIFHIEGVSHGRDETSGIKAYQSTNAKKFFQRWQQTLSTHRENAVEPDLEAHRASRSNILIVEACMITPDQDSGSVRMLNLLRILRDEGHHVTFVADNLDGNPRYAEMLTSIGVEVLHGKFAGNVRKVLRDRGDSLDTIIFCRHYIAVKYVSTVRSLAPKAIIIFDTVDLHFVREEREATLLGNAAMVRSAALTRVKELSIIQKCDVTVVVSDFERNLLAHLVPTARVDIISNISMPATHVTSVSERNGILFIGGFRHAPNVDAIKWYVSEVFPIVRQLLPNVVTTVVGSNMPDEVAALRQDGLRILGFVEDTVPLLRSARVSIAPLRYGAGIKGKINEAMNHGIPVVATECAVEGMQLVSGQDVLVADDANNFAQAIALLHNDAELWHAMSAAGRSNVLTYFSPDAARPAIRALLIPPLPSTASAVQTAV